MSSQIRSGGVQQVAPSPPGARSATPNRCSPRPLRCRRREARGVSVPEILSTQIPELMAGRAGLIGELPVASRADRARRDALAREGVSSPSTTSGRSWSSGPAVSGRASTSSPHASRTLATPSSHPWPISDSRRRSARCQWPPKMSVPRWAWSRFRSSVAKRLTTGHPLRRCRWRRHRSRRVRACSRPRAPAPESALAGP